MGCTFASGIVIALLLCGIISTYVSVTQLGYNIWLTAPNGAIAISGESPNADIPTEQTIYIGTTSQPFIPGCHTTDKGTHLLGVLIRVWQCN